MSNAANAQRFWADSSVSLLYGEDYAMTPFQFDGEETAMTTMTLEHVSGYDWGGIFFFVDRNVGEEDFNETYGEFSPKYILFTPAEGGLIKTVNAAFTYEFGTSYTGSSGSGFSQDNYLYGIGADLNVPGMNFMSLTYYYSQRNNTFYNGDNDHQLTLTYGWSQGNFNIDGFLDWSTGTDKHDAEFNFTPQLTYNIAPALGLTEKLKVGIEYSYWNNKFGGKGLDDKIDDQNAISLLIKAHI
ncbi:MAG: hypothetical protein P1U57_08695 [Oleibacter sp.]|nr:hypothetical protein [Thalassolituus sp.]